MSQCCGTKGHLAPEQKSLVYDQKIDIWAFSIIIAKFLKHKNFNYFSYDNYKIDLKHFEIQVRLFRFSHFSIFFFIFFYIFLHFSSFLIGQISDQSAARVCGRKPVYEALVFGDI